MEGERGGGFTYVWNGTVNPPLYIYKYSPSPPSLPLLLDFLAAAATRLPPALQLQTSPQLLKHRLLFLSLHHLRLS